MAVILYMGRSCEFLGKDQETINLPDTVTTSDALRGWLNGRANQSEQFLDKSIRLCLNNKIQTEPCLVSNEDEIAFLPPMGGG